MPEATHEARELELRRGVILTVEIAGGVALAYLVGAMLWSGALFRQMYSAGVPPWVHAAIALTLLATVMYRGARGLWRLPWPAIRTRIPWKATTIVAVLVVLAIAGWEHFRPVPPISGGSREAELYLDEALGYLQSYYFRRDQVDWAAVREAAYSRARGARTARDTFPAIEAAIRKIGDPHTMLWRSDWRKVASSEATRNAMTTRVPMHHPQGHLTLDRVAYVWIPSYLGGGYGSLYFLTDSNGRAYRQQVRNILRELDSHDPIGWVIDLRADSGGNMWPVLDGLAPLLGEGRIGGVDRPGSGTVDTWLIDGRATSGPPWLAGLGLFDQPMHLRHAEAPVAVLVGGHTASAGEAVAVAFEGRPHTTFIGTRTAGLCTAPQGVSLGQGAELMITIGRLVDRRGHAYEGPIIPDQIVNGSLSTSRFAAVDDATRWLQAQRSHPS